MILDIHTHRPAPYPIGLVSQSALLPFNPVEGQLYSVGIHPWDVTPEISETEYKALEDMALRQEVAAIGECGIDLLRGGPLYKQILIFTRHVELSEQLKKPLIIHCVRAHDHILSLRREMKPVQPWVIHGFRRRASIGRLFTDAGCYLSFGEHFTADAVAACPPCLMLAETDESLADISQIIASLAASLAITPKALTARLAGNTTRLLCGFAGEVDGDGAEGE